MDPGAEGTTLDAEAEATTLDKDDTTFVGDDDAVGIVCTGTTVNVTSETGFEALLMTGEPAAAVVWLEVEGTGMTVSVTRDTEDEMADPDFVGYTVAVR